jgi:hypothetical protein
MFKLFRKLESYFWLWMAECDYKAGRMGSAVIAYGIANDLILNIPLGSKKTN